MDRQTLLDLIPAYALGALDAEEYTAVAVLLETDTEARRILAEYQAIADHLTLATPARRAPAHLQDDLRRRLAAQRQPSVAAPAPTSEPVQTYSSGAAASRNSGKPAAPTTFSTAPTVTPEIKIVRRNIWPLVAAAAAVVVVIIGALVLLRPRDAGEQLYSQLVAQADARRIPISASEDFATNGELVMSGDGGQAVIRVSAMPSLNADQTFELWLVDDNGARSGGTMKLTSPETTYYIVLPLEKSALDYDGFGVSIEPEGGSPDPNGPTGPRVFGVAT